MQNAGGYLSEKRGSPVSLGAAVAINGALVGALLLASPQVQELVPVIFTTIHVPTIKPEPVLPPPMPKTEIKPKPSHSVPTRSQTPVVDNNRPSDGHIDYVTPTGPGTGAGTGTIIETVTPPHVPVFTGTKFDPRFARQMQPDYPPGLQRRGIQGMVEVRVLVGADGRVKDIQLVSVSEPGFFEATREQAIKRWRFLPATRDGVPVESWRSMTVRFKLDGRT